MRLISFLGTGEYKATSYVFEGRTTTTEYVSLALAQTVQPREVLLLATDEAWSKHGESLRQKLTEAGHPTPQRVAVPTGGNAEQLWELFHRIVEALRTSPGPILLDITHGFRMQPFFAAACLQFVQAVVPQVPPIRVVYGEYRPAAESPIWELTPFLEVLSWSRSLMLFLRTGQADEVVEPTKALGRQLSRQWAVSGKQGDQPQLRHLADALREFSDDFTTIRIGSLLLGTLQRPGSSARRLVQTIQQTQAEAAQWLPTLGLVLDQVQAMVQPLIFDGELSSPAGQRALLALARLYVQLGRYSEASSVLREGWITLAAPPVAARPGLPEYSGQARELQEQRWREQTPQALSVSELRNDIQHAGFQIDPKSRDWFERQLNVLLDQWQRSIPESQ